jgi:23S rRNA pseudouridine2604 synthase
MKLPTDRKKAKKMQGPTQFIKNTSKRKSLQKPIKSRNESKFQTTQRIAKTIAENRKIPKKPAKQKTFTKTQKPKNKILLSTLPAGYERLEKYLAQSGLASRREAKSMIKKGFVMVNGKKIYEPGFGVSATDTVSFKHGVQENKETLLFYKPRGVETVKTDPANTDIHDRFPQFAHLNPVGRLDKDTEGLILLSNDGVLAKIITGENSTIEKEYRVTVREDVMPVLLKKMEDGIVLDRIPTKPCVAKKLNGHEYTITLTEGRKHQVRRMANACKFTVTKLVRIRIGNLTIGKMTAGNFKILTPEQVTTLKK